MVKYILRDISKRRGIMNIGKKDVLLHINGRLTFKDKLILHIFKRYTYIIYNMGYLDGFNFRD